LLLVDRGAAGARPNTGLLTLPLPLTLLLLLLLALTLMLG
jgi:hypothetical protein